MAAIDDNAAVGVEGVIGRIGRNRTSINRQQVRPVDPFTARSQIEPLASRPSPSASTTIYTDFI